LLKRLIFFLLIAGGAACHTMQFEVTDQRESQVVFERKHFFLWGLVPTVEVDVRQHCPNGLAAVREQTTFVDGLFDFFTLGIWSPRSSWYYCLPAPGTGGAQ